MAYPYGWTASDVEKGIDLAYRFGAEPQDLFALWYHESAGLDPRIGPTFGNYYGLIGGWDPFISGIIGASWKDIVKTGTIAQQLNAIEKVMRHHERQLGETFASRASRIGTTPAAMIYAMNFVPAYAMRIKNANDVLIGGNDAYYRQNPAFDTEKKGYISIRDLEEKIEKVKGMMARSNVASIYQDLPAANPYARAGVITRIFSSPSGGTNWKLILGVLGISAATYTALVYAKQVPSPKRLFAGEGKRRRRRLAA